MHARRYLLTATAAISLALAPSTASASESPTPRLEKFEAFVAATTVSPGRTLELVRPLVPDVAEAMIVAQPHRAYRLGRRAVLVPATVIVFEPAATPQRIDLLVRERRSGRKIVRVLLPLTS